MDYRKAIEEIGQGKRLPIYYLFGEEWYLRNQFLNQMNNSFEDSTSFEYVHFDMNDTSLDEIIDEGESFSFFAEFRLIYVTNATFIRAQSGQLNKGEEERLIDYIKDPNPSSIIIFSDDSDKLDGRKKIYKELNKRSYLVAFPKLNEFEVSQYIKNYINNNQLNFTEESFNELLDRVNFQLSFAMNEIQKLQTYADSKTKITTDIVKDLVPRTLVSNVFQLSNAIVEKRFENAVQIYEDLILLRNDPVGLHNIMVIQFRIILQSKILVEKGYSQGDIANYLKVHPYRVKLAIQSGKAIELSELKSFYLDLADIDYQLKTGIGLKDTHFFVLLTKLMRI